MPNLQPFAQVIIEDPSGKYGHVNYRPYSYRASAAKDESENWGLENLYHDKIAGIVILEPQYNPIANGTTDWTLSGTYSGTATNWKSTRHPETGLSVVYTPYPGTNINWSASRVATTSSFWLDFCLAGLAVQQGIGTATGQLQFKYPSQSEKHYRVSLQWNRPMRMEYTTDSGTTYDSFGAAIDGAAKSPGFQQWARIMFLSVGNDVFCNVNGHDWLRHHNADAGSIFSGNGTLSITGTGMTVALGYHSMAFLPNGTCYGGSITTGNVIQGIPRVNISGTNPTGMSMSGTVTTVEGAASFEYSFSLESGAGTNYADDTPIFSSIEISYPGDYGRITSPSYAEIDHVQGITEHIVFDQTNLNIYTEAVITCSNADADFSGWSGVRACGLNLGYYGEGVQRRLTGLCGHLMEWSTDDPSKVFRLHAYDRSVMLKAPAGVMVANLPYFDGWCAYKAMRYLANYAGITDEWLAFPLCEGDALTPCEHYLLPYGDQFHPLVRFPGGMYIWDCMQNIQRYVGYILFFDSIGLLRFYPWIPNAPGPFKKNFSLIADTDGNGIPLRNEMFFCGRTRDLTSVRNDVTIIGIDPNTWNPIVAHNRDNDSIYNPNVENYLGYRSSMVWADSMFVTSGYALQALNSIFGMARLPQDTITLRGWMQPELFPLDIVGVTDPFSSPGGRPYWITEITNDCSVDQGTQHMQIRPTCTLRGQWLTPWG